MFRKIMSILIAVAFGLALPAGADAATVNAGSCSRADVQTAVNSAASNDTVAVPAGNCSWSSAIDISGKSKINIIGAGIDITTLTCTSGTCFNAANAGTSPVFRISGFTMQNAAGGELIGLQGVSSNWFRIDHNKMIGETDLATLQIAGYGGDYHPAGLIDNNTGKNLRIVVLGTAADLPSEAKLWTVNPDFGGPTRVVYIEANTTTNNIHSNFPDCHYGGNYVARFNVLNGTVYSEVHSVQGADRGCQRWEIYNNVYNMPEAYSTRVIYLRSGSGYVFNNTASQSNNDWIQLNNVRSCRDPGDTNGKCSGASNWDQNTSGQSGYACRDQIGRSRDTSVWAAGRPYAQALTPAYIFNNKLPNAAEVPTVVDAGETCSPSDLNSTHIQANRDYYTYNASCSGAACTTGVGTGTALPATCTVGTGYWKTNEGNWNHSGAGGQGVLYKCTSANTWTLSYTPYTYPHPVQGGAPPVTTIDPPHNLRVVQE